MSKVRFTRHAREDLLDIWLYIAARSSDTVADQVYDRIEQTCQLLKHNPQLGPARPEIAESEPKERARQRLAKQELTNGPARRTGQENCF